MAANETKTQQTLSPREQAIRQLKVKGYLDQDGKPMGRRQFMVSLALAWATFAAALGGLVTILSAFIIPRVDFTRIESFKVGAPGNFPSKTVNEDFKSSGKFWIVNDGQKIFALSVVCTHLGCTPNWMSNESKFKCPCHGSGFTMQGKNFEGPAPTWLRRYEVSLADDGQIVVNKGRLFFEEKGEFEDPRSYIAV
ncbi:MAG: Cytochrome b6-f complex iron-sulfur subunit [Verrucomicrobiae bacterium]|nr:Cytochrome b6-f complex iron-sulfur subunit [Verrucomicrobiae bacterium]